MEKMASGCVALWFNVLDCMLSSDTGSTPGQGRAMDISSSSESTLLWLTRRASARFISLCTAGTRTTACIKDPVLTLQ